MTTKLFTLDLTKFDDSDHNATTYDHEIRKKLNISQQTVNKYLPRKLYPRDRDTGIIRGIKLRVVEAFATEAFATEAFANTQNCSEPIALQKNRLETVIEEPDHDADAEAEEAEVIELALKRKRKQKELINIKEVIQTQYESKAEAHSAISRLARAYEDLCTPLTYLGKPKKDLKSWFKDDIWLHHNSTLKEIKCPCCQIRHITSESFSAGHIQAESREGSSQIDNIIPICKECNGRMGSSHMYWFAWDRYGTIMFKI